jgi:hypothetical protein
MGSVDDIAGGAEVPMAGGLHLHEEGVALADLTLPQPMYQAFALQVGRVDRHGTHIRGGGSEALPQVGQVSLGIAVGSDPLVDLVDDRRLRNASSESAAPHGVKASTNATYIGKMPVW